MRGFLHENINPNMIYVIPDRIRDEKGSVSLGNLQ